MTNFNPILDTDEKFLAERYTRELMEDGLAWDTLNMSDGDLRSAIIADLVSFLMWEKEKNTKLHITFEELTRFVDRSDVERIRQQLDHSEIKHLFDFDGNVYRMKDNHEILQAAMDFSGIWYDNFTPDSGDDVVKINHDVLHTAVTKHGGIDNLAAALSMELECNVPGNNRMN